MAVVFDRLYEDLKDYPEAAVVITLDDLRTTEGKYWPETYDIVKSVKEYTDFIYQVLDYFKQGETE